MSLGVEFLPVDVTQLVAVALGCMIPLIFVVGITMRFAAKPLVEALGEAARERRTGPRAGGAEPPGARAGARGAPPARAGQGSSAPALEPGSALRLRR